MTREDLMSKDELILLLKEYNSNVSKLKLRKKEKKKYEAILESKLEMEIIWNVSNEINSDIRSKNKISDKVGNTVVNSIAKNEQQKENAKIKIVELEQTIKELEDKVEEVEIRLGSLCYKEREILIAYYVENRTAEDISQNLYFELFNRTCSIRYIRDIIKTNTEKMLNL